MFSFFGLFADPAEGLAEQISTTWPGADVIPMEEPIPAIGARFGQDLYQPDLEDIPEAVARVVESLSAQYPSARFLLLRTECWGGQCWDWGRIIQGGHVVLEAEGDRALGRLIKHWGFDLGPNEIFSPLRRDFPWRQ
jgi:hypothetical protein